MRCEASFTYTEDFGIIQVTIQRIFLATNVTKKLDHNEGTYKVNKWNTSKTKTTSNKADYPEVTAGCDLKQSGSSPTTVTLTAEESAVFVLLEREAEIADVVLDQDSIRAHELQQGNQGVVSKVVEPTHKNSIWGYA